MKPLRKFGWNKFTTIISLGNQDIKQAGQHAVASESYSAASFMKAIIIKHKIELLVAIRLVELARTSTAQQSSRKL